MLTKFGKIANTFNGNDAFLPWLNNSNQYVCGILTKNVLGDNKYVNPIQYSGFSTEWNLISTSITQNYTGGNSSGFALGSGTTPPTENDYTMENQILGLTMVGSASSTGKTYDSENDCMELYKSIIISNDTGSDVTITELGLFRAYNSSTTKGSTSGSLERFMTDHTILDEPVVIPNGESGVIRIKGIYLFTEE